MASPFSLAPPGQKGETWLRPSHKRTVEVLVCTSHWPEPSELELTHALTKNRGLVKTHEPRGNPGHWANSSSCDSGCEDYRLLNLSPTWMAFLCPQRILFANTLFLFKCHLFPNGLLFYTCPPTSQLIIFKPIWHLRLGILLLIVT